MKFNQVFLAFLQNYLLFMTSEMLNNNMIQHITEVLINLYYFVLDFTEEKIHLGEAPFDDVHALTGSLKLYFRELPEPLIPYDFFSGFVEAISKL